MDCEHDYINAAYIDVSFVHANTYGEIMYTGLTNSAPLHLTLRAIPKARGTLLPKVSPYTSSSYEVMNVLGL